MCYICSEILSGDYKPCYFHHYSKHVKGNDICNIKNEGMIVIPGYLSFENVINSGAICILIQYEWLLLHLWSRQNISAVKFASS